MLQKDRALHRVDNPVETFSDAVARMDLMREIGHLLAVGDNDAKITRHGVGFFKGYYTHRSSDVDVDEIERWLYAKQNQKWVFTLNDNVFSAVQHGFEKYKIGMTADALKQSNEEWKDTRSSFMNVYGEKMTEFGNRDEVFDVHGGDVRTLADEFFTDALYFGFVTLFTAELE